LGGGQLSYRIVLPILGIVEKKLLERVPEYQQKADYEKRPKYQMDLPSRLIGTLT